MIRNEAEDVLNSLLVDLFKMCIRDRYCTLYAKCTRMNRGRQKLVMGCPMYLSLIHICKSQST